MNKWLELIIGLVLVIAAIYFAWGIYPASWGNAAITVLKGGIVWFVIMVGLLLLLLGISDLKE
jgi:predicted phage tail protein